MVDSKQPGAVTPIEPMPWTVAARLRCLEVARDMARVRGVRDVLSTADEYMAWLLGPLPPARERSETEPKQEAGRPGADRA